MVAFINQILATLFSFVCHGLDPFNQFESRVALLCPLKTPEKLKVFWCFQGVKQFKTGLKWVNSFYVTDFYTPWQMIKRLNWSFPNFFKKLLPFQKYGSEFFKGPFRTYFEGLINYLKNIEHFFFFFFLGGGGVVFFAQLIRVCKIY